MQRRPGRPAVEFHTRQRQRFIVRRPTRICLYRLRRHGAKVQWLIN